MLGASSSSGAAPTARSPPFPDRCPHREAPLSAGEVDDGCLVCPYHGWTFDAGRALRPRAVGQRGVPVPPRAHLTPFDCQERYGLVWVCLGEPAGDIPTMRWEDDPAFRRINPPVEVWHTSTPRMTDNFLDITHFPYVHGGHVRQRQDPRVPKIELERLDDEFYGYRYEVRGRQHLRRRRRRPGRRRPSSTAR